MTAVADDPFELMRVPAPAVTPAAALEFLGERWNLGGELEPLVSERDQNFLLRAADGARFVLKISNPGEAPAVLDFQARALEHVARLAPALPVPHVVPSRGGRMLERIETSGGDCLVRIVSWLDGTPLDDVPWTPRLRKHLAGTMAKLGLALRGFFHPAARHPLLWDVNRADAAAALTAHIDDPARRTLAERNFERHQRQVAPLLAGLRAQVIHNDCNPDNVLVARDDPEAVSGIVDFGDMVHAPLVNDLAVAIAYQLVDQDDPLAVACELVAAYHATCPLEPAELRLLFDLVSLRLTMSVAICAWRAKRHPENVDYILGHHERYWATLARLDALDPRDAERAFLGACGRSPATSPRYDTAADAALRARREKLLGPSLRLSYDEPLHLVRGEGAWLYDARDRAYLDAYNNVACVGHSHPDVVAAIAAQARRLNTNTRYLHEHIVDYAGRLAERMPGDLSVCFFVCTGSEANDLAWQIACAATGGTGAIVTDFAYHGNTTVVAQLSPEELPPERQEDWVATVPPPDTYRDPREGDAGESYAAELDTALATLAGRGHRPAAFFVDTMYTSDGIHVAPPGYLAAAWRRVRAAGGLCVADEVQAGFGRTGDQFWGFGDQDAVPDIVTLGKPIGNGHPLAAVVTTPAIAERFAAGRYYFNTFGGNPVACAAGLAVLDVLERERLVDNTRQVGAYLRERLDDLALRHALIGDVRGRGLFYGVDLVRDRATRAPDPDAAHVVMNELRQRGVLVGRTGRHANVLKIRPPLVFSRDNADLLATTLDEALAATLSRTSPPA